VAGPIVPDLPRRTQRLSERYTSPDSPLSSLTPSAQRAVQRIDSRKLTRGSNLLTDTEASIAGRAAQNLAPTLPTPQTNLIQGLIRNVGDIATGIPKLPVAIAKEIHDLRDIGGNINRATSAASNPLEALGNIATVPGLRLVPGAYVAENLFASENPHLPDGAPAPSPSQLTQNPLFAALDVLPFATGAARSTRTVRTATTLAEKNARVLNTLPQRIRPFSTLARNWRPGGPRTTTRTLGGVDPETGASLNRVQEVLEPNRFGDLMGDAGEWWRGTSVGRTVDEAFGGQSREAARMVNRRTGDIQAMGTGDDPILTSLNATPGERVAGKIASEFTTWEKKYADISAQRRAEIHRSLELDTDLPNLTALEADYINTYRTQSDALLQAQLKNPSPEFRVIDFGGKTEIFDIASARKIQAARNRLDLATSVRDIKTISDPATLAARIDSIVSNPALSKKFREGVARVGVARLRAMGATVPDRSTLRAHISSSSPLNIPTSSLTPRPSPSSLLDPHLNPILLRDPSIRALASNLRSSAWSEARKHLRQIESRANPPLPPALTTAIRESIATESSLARSVSHMERNITILKRPVTDANLERIITTAQSAADSVPPARFYPLVQQQLKERFRQRGTSAADAWDPGTPLTDETFLRLIDEGSFDELFTRDTINQGRREVQQSWQEIRDIQGKNPVYVHRVTPDKAIRRRYAPRAMDFEPNLTQTKARLWDASDTITDPLFALQAQAMEVLIRKGSRLVLDDLISTQAITGRMLRERFRPMAQRAVAKTGEDFNTALTRLIEREFTRFDPQSFLNPSRQTISPYASSSELYLPRSIQSTIDRMKPGPSDLGSVLDTPTRIFRTSLLPLSPRWHLYNIVGGGIMVAMRSPNPLLMGRYAKDAWRMAKGSRDGGRGGLAAISPLAAPGGDVASQGMWLRQMDRNVRLTRQARAQVLYHVKSGMTLRRLHDQARDSRLADLASRGVQKSYEINQLFDDFYRSLAYLENTDAAIRRGLSQPEAVNHGIAHARRALQEWDTLTPMERQTMRFLFPFYSWTRFLLKWTLTYPVDHPVRMAIISTLARTELSDLQTGLPQNLRDLLFLGEPDENGVVRGFNITGSNPFRDVANYASLLGFALGDESGDLSAITGNINPAIGTFLEYLGVDTMSGNSDLYPQLRYNPITGNLDTVRSDNPITTALGNFAPHTRAITSLLGMNDQFKALMAEDPEAAGRMLASSVGIPVLFRDVDLPYEHARAELNRLDAMKRTRSDAMRSGDLSPFDRYPTLAPLRDALSAMQESGEFTPPQPTPDRWGSVREGGRVLNPF